MLEHKFLRKEIIMFLQCGNEQPNEGDEPCFICSLFFNLHIKLSKHNFSPFYFQLYILLIKDTNSVQNVC